MTRKLLRILPILVCALFFISTTSGCDKKGEGDESAEEKMEPLPEAANGSPLAAELVSLDGNDLKVKVYNHGEEKASTYVILARYMDADGNVLKYKPGTSFEAENDFTSVSGGKYAVAPGEGKEFTVTMMEVPEGTVSAELLVSMVEGKSGEIFSQESWREWPEDLEAQ